MSEWWIALLQWLPCIHAQGGQRSHIDLWPLLLPPPAHPHKHKMIDMSGSVRMQKQAVRVASMGLALFHVHCVVHNTLHIARRTFTSTSSPLPSAAKALKPVPKSRGEAATFCKVCTYDICSSYVLFLKAGSTPVHRFPASSRGTHRRSTQCGTAGESAAQPITCDFQVTCIFSEFRAHFIGRTMWKEHHYT